MKKNILTILLIICSIVMIPTNIHARNNHEEVSITNNEAMTEKKGYPVINIKNNTDEEMVVNYYVYVDEEEEDYKQSNLTIPKNQVIQLEISELSFLGKNQVSRNVWFSWEVKGLKKSKEAQIITHKFKLKEAQLG